MDVRWNPEQPIEDVEEMGKPDTPPELVEEISELRRGFGKDLVLLGHHYQRDDVVRFADKRGDSLALSQYAASMQDAKFVIFLGVHFMAETADMLTDPDVPVILPDMRAGCTMADMAEIDDIEEAWEKLSELMDTETLTPITYINSTAEVKEFVGRHGGTICTSSNAKKIIRWAMEQGERIMFFPDQHLGRNTSYELGIPLEKMIVWNWQEEDELGGNTSDDIRNSRVILWHGHCSVHQHFTPAHVEHWRNTNPDVNVIVHPECSFEVVQKADYNGSTSAIINTILDAAPGTKWAVGTENHLVQRIGNEVREQGKEVFSLAPYACLCSTMFRISPWALRDSLKALQEGKFRFRITVDEETRKWSNIALERMFEITAKGNGS
ncbi:quinolinate synthase NadA [bacterium]|nr:quinolinate synthase NadA [bacterium]